METPRTLPPSAGDSAYRMADVSGKAATRRRALALGRIRMAAATWEAVRERRLPKGDALPMAEAAGIMAAKRASELLPLCHPLALESVRVAWRFIPPAGGWGEIEAGCEVVCSGKTGAEMEALAGVSAALLCVYDLAKTIDPVLEITGIHLVWKEGGKSGSWRSPLAAPEEAPPAEAAPWQGIRIAVLTVSDRCARSEASDATGPLIRDFALARGAAVREISIVPDEPREVEARVREWVSGGETDVVIVTGGTGISERDRTPEALEALFDKTLAGFGERLRARGSQQTNWAWMSRACAGVAGGTLVFLLPGSRGGVRDGLAILEESLGHALHVLRGGGHGPMAAGTP